MNREDYFKYYIQGSDHYLIPRDIFEELFNEMNNWKEEAQQLKERVTYLENSNNRREETIISLRNEQQLDLYKKVIDEVREYIRENRLYNYKYDEEELFEIITDENAKEDLLQILDKAKEMVKDE